jgi:Fic family protein
MQGALDAGLIAHDAALAQADRALGALAGALQSLPDADAVTAMLRRQEAVASGRIEGVQASLIDLLDAEAGLLAMGPGRDIAELRALTEQLQRHGDGPWGERLNYVHDHLLRGVGRRGVGLRKSRTWLGVSGSTLAEASYVPPAPQEIPLLLGQWQQWLERADGMHPLQKVALAYAGIESIHPYQDANGRVARWFLQHWLVAQGLLPAPALLWSDELRRTATQWHRARHALRARHAHEEWMDVFLEGIRAAAVETARSVQRVAALREQHRREITHQFGRVAGTALTVLDALIAQPMLSVKDLVALTGTTFPAANELAQRLVRAGILAEVTGNMRNRRYRYAPLVRIFIADEFD